MNNLIYKAEKLKIPVTIERKEKNSEEIANYQPSNELIKAVNLAIFLKRPLLIMGEPGSGKTKLAQAIAYELYHNCNGIKDYDKMYFEWNIKSSSKAQDGLYEFDAMDRLLDAQSKERDEESKEFKAKNKNNYIKPRALAKAFDKSISENKRAVILIDEIDKADLDFPNDLLDVLEKSEYKELETDKLVKADYPPIVIITSNQERDMPDAFLRRCLFHFIKPLEEDKLREIINYRFFKGKTLKKDENYKLIEKVVLQFIKIREKVYSDKINLEKSISTSELIDWFSAIKHYKELKKDDPEDEILKDLISDADVDNINANLDNIPFYQILFKNYKTLLAFDNEH